MHITEGIITGAPVVAYTGVGIALVAWGANRMKRFVARSPDKKPLLGMGCAMIFFFSLIPIPAFTGTCSHPCGTPLIAILLGPSIGIALAGVSLLLQAAFFAHGGFSTWGANVLALGLCGCLFGWGAFRLARALGIPLWAAGLAGGIAGDLAVYAASGMILAYTLAAGSTPQYSFSGYLAAIYAAYLPTQFPIAVGEMLVTGLALQSAFKQRPDVLEELGVLGRRAGPAKGVSTAFTIALLAGLFLILPSLMDGAERGTGHASGAAPASGAIQGSTSQGDLRETGLIGMDEAVNERMAAAAGVLSREPFINTEAMGDLWNAILLLAGGVCGFVLGKWWHLLWGRRQEG